LRRCEDLREDPRHRGQVTQQFSRMLLVIVWTLPSAAFADAWITPPEAELGSTSPFELNEDVAASVLLTGVTIGLAPVLSGWGPHGQVAPLDPNSVNDFDRFVVGNHSETSNLVSDVFLYTNIALPFAVGAIDVLTSHSVDGWPGYGKDALVMLETLSMTIAVCNTVRYTARRYRPAAYDDSRAPDGGFERSTEQLSFFSGHTSQTFAMATAFSYLFQKRHPESWLVGPVWAGTHSLAVATAALRMAAGRHFLSDVLTGAAVGSAIGFLVPFLHSVGEGHKSIIGKSDLLADLRLTPMFFERGFGVGAMMIW